MSLNGIIFLAAGIILSFFISHLMIIFIDRPIENIRRKIKAKKSEQSDTLNAADV